MGGYMMPPMTWEDEQAQREREMMEALRLSENAQMPTPRPEAPGNDYLDQYAEHVRTMPQVQDYEPSTLRKILSVIGGTLAGGNPEVTKRLAVPGYVRDMGDWENQATKLKEVAGLGEEARRTGVTARGQDIAADEQRAGREFQAGEAGQERQFRTVESEADRTFRAGEAETERKWREGESKKDRAIQEREVEAREGYYNSLAGARNADRAAALTPDQQLANWKLAAQRVATLHPEWAEFADMQGILPFEEGGFLGIGGMDQVEYEKFVAAVEAQMEAQYPGSMRTTRTDVPPALRPLTSRDR